MRRGRWLPEDVFQGLALGSVHRTVHDQSLSPQGFHGPGPLDLQPVLPRSPQVHLNPAVHQAQHLGQGPACRNAARQVRHVGTVAGAGACADQNVALPGLF